MLARVILAIDRPPLQAQLKRSLSHSDVIVETLRGKRDLWKRMARENADMFVVSHSLIPEPVSDTLAVLRELPDFPMVVVLSDRKDPAEHSRLLAAGCEAVLPDTLPAEQLHEVLDTLLYKRGEASKKDLAGRRDMGTPRLGNFVASSPAMRTFMALVRRVVGSDVSLLIQGETGVGKEHLARAIHAESPRADGPFIAVNCGALPESLLESELFGHEEGAFTGASRARRGWFELAHRGAIFLDEIGEMPYHLQVKLLRVLQEHAIQRVGSERAIPIDVRVIAATNQDLEQQVHRREFRRDLYYRLSVVTLTVPPLRERIEDIPELVQSYIGYFQSRIGSYVEGIRPEALEALARYSWPGNVRELINVIERAMLLCADTMIGLRDLPPAISGEVTRESSSGILGPDLAEGEVPESWLDKPWGEVRRTVLETCERGYLAAILRQTDGRVGATAKRAGMQPRSLYEKMKRYGLSKEQFRRGAKRGAESQGS